MLTLLACLLALVPRPQEPEGYQLPPPELVALLDAPLIPSQRISPDARWALESTRAPMPSIEDVARPWVGLAGLRIDPAACAPFQTSYDSALALRSLDTGLVKPVALPPGAQLASLAWSHTSQRFAFTLRTDAGTELWVCALDGQPPRRVVPRLHALFGGFQWHPDGRQLFVALPPAGQGAAPERPRVPSGPAIMESSGSKTPIRTYQDLLQDEHDAQLFEHFARAELALVDPDAGKLQRIGKSELIASFEPSPDGQHLLVECLRRPFSYVLGLERFGGSTEVWSLDGKLERVVHAHGLLDAIPVEGVPVGPREARWRPGEPATLVWVEALDGGDPKNKVEARDQWLAQPAPFTAEPTLLLRCAQRARGLVWFADARLVLASEYDRDKRWLKATLVDLAQPAQPGRVLEDRSINDRYGNPGAIATEPRADGTRVAKQRGAWVLRTGEGASKEGNRPFLDRQNLESGATERLWRCESGVYESVAAIARWGDAAQLPAILTRRESAAQPPNLWRRELDGGKSEQLTRFADPQPQIRGIEKRLVTYARPDGVPLSATLYTPAGYTPGQRLPLVVWAYPLEFNDAATAGQVSAAPTRFTQIRGLSQLAFLTQGYALMDDATMPIVGDPETMNDSFLEQIAAAAKAAIDKAVELGVADPARVGVGGHSYGAFMTANLLAHTDLFRAGCARSGAYNRTLTPFGFQSERRNLWEALQIYEQLSPFLAADKIRAPLLMIHGAKDANPGTFPMQSERLYQAIAGLGGKARLVLLPEESHGYVARESVLHVQAEMIRWFDRYVKNAPPLPVEAGAGR